MEEGGQEEKAILPQANKAFLKPGESMGAFSCRWLGALGQSVFFHLLNEHEFEQTLKDSEGQGSLACCSPWGHKESDMTE